MMKHSLTLLVAAATTALAGCQLYFGDGGSGDRWTYCGSDGYYTCEDDECEWAGPTCPSGTATGSAGGYECNDHTDCAAGCYCTDAGLCEEAGFCAQDDDCGPGYTCDESRSSCVPDDQPTTCATDHDCEQGQYCDSETLECTATCVCATDAEAVAQGFDYCDESRLTCLPGIDPAGDCAGELTCNIGRPTCPEGQVAMISEGCYTGACQPIASCATAPGCSAYGHESDCFADDSCAVTYTGIGCKKPDNTPCQAGDTNCTCEEYRFASCHDNTGTPRTVEFNGFTFDISELTLRN